MGIEAGFGYVHVEVSQFANSLHGTKRRKFPQRENTMPESVNVILPARFM